MDEDLVIVALFSFCFLVTDNIYFLVCNRARRQIIYPLDQLGGNAPSKRILTNQVTDCIFFLLNISGLDVFGRASGECFITQCNCYLAIL